MIKNVSLLLLTMLVLGFVGCKPEPEPIIIVVPPAPRSPHALDTARFYAQFTWIKQKDTVTMMEPVDTTSMDSTYYFQIPMEIENQPIIDTFGVDESTDIDELDTIGWVYAPTSSFFHYNYIQLARGQEDFETNQNKNLLSISFPYVRRGDTTAFWDISYYRANPSVQVGSVGWGRVGYIDSLTNMDARSGVMISYTDNNGVEWRSDFKPAFQSFGYFQIDSLYTNKFDNLSYDIIVGRFAARLYNDLGEGQDMKNGKFRMRIQTDIEFGPAPL